MKHLSKLSEDKTFSTEYPSRIVLIGFAACYKTSVGKLLADMLGCEFLDTDAEIERRCNSSVQQIFETQGEEYFRTMENELLTTLKANSVVACGGGSVLAPNFEKLACNSVVICLTATAETVCSRLGTVARPLFDGLTVDQLQGYMSRRASLYAKFAHLTFPTDGKTPEQVAEQIYAALKYRGN